MEDFEKILKSYNYHFPPELIAQEPASPRDSAKLLIYDRESKTVRHDRYKNILEYLPKNGVLVLNQTKVLPARLEVTKPSGGKARLLYIEQEKNLVKFLSDRKLEITSQVKVNSQIKFEVTKKEDSFYFLKPLFKTSVIKILERYGKTPLPPYIKNPTLKGKKLLSEYNTVFAKKTGSVAAPTASLHFTKALLNKIKKAGIEIKYVTLHVNLGTFAKLSEDQWKNKKLHSEWYEIDRPTGQFLNQAKKSKRPIIAVGTTVVRTLESAADNNGKLTKLSGSTNLFITEKTKLKFVDCLATNFHVPQSSLLMLVSAFTGREKLLNLYDQAIHNSYRLFSFGDGMLIK
jgi:S-adenosylmethionine:tRNA ribosyltransferase-isomerase